MSVRTLVLAVASLAAAAALSACSTTGSPGAAVPAPLTVPTAGTEAVPSDPGTDGAVAGAAAAAATTKLDMRVRVVDLWVPKGATAGADIDVWVGSPDSGGHKLRTVGYGKVSDFFPPETLSPDGDNPQWELSFYTAGRTGAADHIIDQGESSAPGLTLTMSVMPGDPDGTGGSLQVFTDDVGSHPAGSGFHHPSVPAPPAGSALLATNAAALQALSPSNDPGWSVATGGTCANYLDVDTGKPHSDPNVVDNLGGTSTLDYLVKPGTPVDIVRNDPDETGAAACARAGAVRVDPHLSAGGRAYAFLHGPTLATVQLLVVPIG